MEEQTNTPIVPPTETVVSNPTKKRYLFIGLVALATILLAVATYIIAKNRNTQQTNYTASYIPQNQRTSNPTTPPAQLASNNPQANLQPVNKTSSCNQQLNHDLQTIQGNLNQLKSDQNNANQAIQNQAKDTQ